MQRFLLQVWQEDDGVLSFEWTLLVTVLAIGIVGGLAGARDAIIDELGDVAHATISFDQSYSLPPLTIGSTIVIPGQTFVDTQADFSADTRGTLEGQAPSVDITGDDGG